MTEISDEKFKVEVLRLMKTVVVKVGENAKDIALIRKDIDKSTKEFKSLKNKFELILVF